jgi:hypothetical protein
MKLKTPPPVCVLLAARNWRTQGSESRQNCSRRGTGISKKLWLLIRSSALRPEIANIDGQIKLAQVPEHSEGANRARKLSDELQSSTQQCEASPRIAEKWDAEFNQRAHYYCDLERKNSGAEQLIVKTLERMSNA